MQFAGKVAVVTGAARGIGLGVATALAEGGAKVYLADRDTKEGTVASVALLKKGLEVHFRQLDVTDPASWAKLRASVEESSARLDILVNCAGRTVLTPIAKTSWDEIRSLFDINLGGTYMGTREFTPLLAKRGAEEPWAVIVNISSMAARSGVPFFTAYGASKAAVSSFTKTAALEFARLKQPIRVNAVLPGTIDTGMSHQVQEDLLQFGGTPEELRAQSIAKHPVRRWGVVDDIVHAVLYLADDRASFTTGLNLTVGGGREAQ